MIHDGHRERLRKKFCQGALEDHELLELLLFYSIPRCNTNETAHELLLRFGSLDAVMRADMADLKTVTGIGETSAIQIKAVGEIMARCARSRVDDRHLLSSYEALEAYLLALFIGSAREKTFLLLFNAANRLICCELLGEGNALQTPVCLRRIVEAALQRNAAAAVLAHNHADGLVMPSEADTETTERVRESLENVGVRFIEHYIVTPDRCIPILRKPR